MYLLIGLMIVGILMMMLSITVLIGLQIIIHKPQKAPLQAEQDEAQRQKMERLQRQFDNMMSYTGVDDGQ